MSGDRLINVVAFNSEPEKEGTVFEGKMVEPRPQQEMLEQYQGWEAELLQILQVRRVLPTWNQMLRALTACFSVLKARQGGPSIR